ncbi:lactonase family protein [Streptomyces iconiensis]|uniref:Lactonase family protein n=1 Tax=Streptomyces iconiensis TaxID=1384038 RepID=A0ABT7A9J1_9ACTN|nr:lactonase family protein [Streptomyces iconiensis]MDJ1137984.1 lactonase family protein [Streptomyces iconiensis]
MAAGGTAAGVLAVGAASGTARANPHGETADGSPREGGSAGSRPLFLGTYTGQPGGGTGIGLAAYTLRTGHLTPRGVVSGVENPSYLALSPDRRTLYAVNESLEAGVEGGVTAVALRPGAPPEVLGRQGTGGAGPCHLSVHPGGRWLLSANYLSGSVAVHPVARDGALGERTDLVTHTSPPPGPGQEGPHAHQIFTAPDGRHVLAVDLGTDTLYTYRLDTRTGRLTPVSRATVRPGAGPRHLTFHPGGRWAYLANEVDNTAVVCAYDPRTGRLAPGSAQSTGTGTGPGESYPAQFAVTRDGRFAYLANRGHNSVTRYAVEARGARLRLLDTVPVGGDFPRHLALSPSGRLLFAANQKSGTVSTFHVDRVTGALSPTGRPFPAPLAVCALPL